MPRTTSIMGRSVRSPLPVFPGRLGNSLRLARDAYFRPCHRPLWGRVRHLADYGLGSSDGSGGGGAGGELGLDGVGVVGWSVSGLGAIYLCGVCEFCSHVLTHDRENRINRRGGKSFNQTEGWCTLDRIDFLTLLWIE